MKANEPTESLRQVLVFLNRSHGSVSFPISMDLGEMPGNILAAHSCLIRINGQTQALGGKIYRKARSQCTRRVHGVLTSLAPLWESWVSLPDLGD